MNLQLLSLTIAAITPLLLSRIATAQAFPFQAVRMAVECPASDLVAKAYPRKLNYGAANLEVKCERRPAGFVKVNFYATSFEDKDQKVHADDDEVVLAPGETHKWRVALQAGGEAAPNAHIEFTIFNDQQP